MITWLGTYGPILLKGLLTTILLAVVGTIGGFIVSLLLVSMKTQKVDVKRDNGFKRFIKRLSKGFSTAYITLFRGTPMIVQAVIFYYGIYGLFPMSNKPTWWTPLFASLILVVLNTAAYIAEILRGSVNAIDDGQMEAARSLGFSRRQALWFVIYPQSIKNSLPSIGNEFIVNLKDTAVLSVIGIFDLFNAAQDVADKDFNIVLAFSVTAVIYLILTGLSSLLIHFLENRNKGVTSNV